MQVLNAGVADFYGPRRTTAAGFEWHMGTNHLGHFLLAALLLPHLIEAGKSEAGARITVVSSSLHDRGKKGPPFDLTDLHLARPGAYQGQLAYSRSKLANLLFAYELHRRLQRAGVHCVAVNAVCPGFIPATRLVRHSGKIGTFFLRYCFGWLLRPVLGFVRTPDEGATVVARLASGTIPITKSGLCWRLRRGSGGGAQDVEEMRTSAESYDEALAAGLWELSCVAVGLPAGDAGNGWVGAAG